MNKRTVWGYSSSAFFQASTLLHTKTPFASQLLIWWRDYGRHNLPWKTTNPYQVWVSEIMLQQTQVSRVVGFYTEFIKRFPTVEVLAAAKHDEVLCYWSGLGYYARARNMHLAAQQIVQLGKFPQDAHTLRTLPGIGTSTAHAILSQAFGIRAPILDANVKRILARYYGMDDDISKQSGVNRLWHLADASMPAQNANHYTQAIMDFGALVCQKKPLCALCPLRNGCYAHINNCTHKLPYKTKKKPKPTRTETFWLVHKNHQVLLRKRPNKGIWGGLWCLPTASEMPFDADALSSGKIWISKQKHTFTHFHLHYDVCLIACVDSITAVDASPDWLWFSVNQQAAIGLPACIQKVIAQWQRYLEYDVPQDATH